MKKIISLLLVVLLSFTFFCACAVKEGGKQSSGSSGNESSVPSGSESGNSGEDGGISEEAYTVSLVYQGQPFVPTGAGTYAQWTGITETGDITGFQTAEFNENGVAALDGLEGEYRVTLGNLPEGYAYNPNLYVTNGDNRNIEIELYPIIEVKKSGKDFYDNVINISQLGVYRVTLKKAYPLKEGVYFQFSIPRDGGVYSVQSIVDVMQNTINPIAEIYTGSSAFKTWSHTCDDGVEFENGSYTKNFYFEGKASTDQQGFAIIPFAVRATTNGISFPITVDFLVWRKDDFPSTHVDAELVYAKQLPSEKAPEGVGTWRGAETLEGGQWMFNGKNYVYNEEDGFYHVGTKDGPYLYVNMDVPDRFIPEYTPPGATTGIPVSFTTIENIAPVAYLRVAQLDHETGERTGKMIHYKPMIEQQYKSVCNSDGRCLVTEELRWFLQEICESQQYFNAGYGWIESYSLTVCGYSVSALEDDQWLFACGYYF